MDGKKEGFGVLISPDGGVYEGQFHDDAPDGHGVFTVPTGKPDFSLSNPLPSDVDACTAKRPASRAALLCQVKSTRGSGELTKHTGRENFPMRTVLPTTVRKGLGLRRSSPPSHGAATKPSFCNKALLQSWLWILGEWRADLQEGYGEERWVDGSSFKGTYKRGEKHGEGVFTWPDGSVYEGQFLHNDIHGSGTYLWADKRKYSGKSTFQSPAPPPR